MRLFIATPLPAPVLAALQTNQAHYNLAGVRLVPAENLHLTLHFLGETSDAALPDLKQKLELIAAHQPAFTLTFKEIAPGPKLRSPRLIWARFQEHPEFRKLSTAIQSALNVQPENNGEFIPHITIARLKKEKLKTDPLPVIRNIDFPLYPVESFAIWQSELGSPHPRYSVLERFTLQPAAAKNINPEP